mmetsp:Transcript_12416/g.15531  ORF Transcript_12416/g.15531 Transcript_12416/m.15531 type:complete len:426 (+) Transcript_12416:62-1339(+)|eukprot:CAMPEP_0172500348 /NCGR_PEP_ID=MMETSP1066-20121228/137153_1 /TAXON_ID=671091 /ORGANISM="Coscinodiscus wailesii, Strain CCMP2513" /LENGTH=425 /DNA_ID=CAMNT_0013274529 /DNA_START=57 /DNA_END=1334 /DNA_ORIENTATION=-
MTESDFDLDEGGWLKSCPRTPKRFSWRNDPQESHSDWKVVIKNADDAERIYFLHKIVLSNGPRASGYFYAQFSTTTVETKTSTTVLQVPNECAKCVPKLLDFVYEGTLHLERDTAVPMMELARRLDIPALGRECTSWIKTALQASDVEFAFNVFAEGDEWRMEKLCVASATVVARMFRAIDSDSLMCLPINLLVQLLKHDELNSTEDYVFELIVAYKDSRKLSPGDVRKLWECCRFAHLSSRKKVAALQQDTFPREVFFEDAVAYIASSDGDDGGDEGFGDCFSAECQQRNKKRKAGSLLTEGAELSVHGHTLKSTLGPCFQVLPESTPDAPSVEQHQDEFQIPRGWRVVKMSDGDFELIRTMVIAEHAWGTDVIHVQDDNKFVAFCCKGFSTPGIVYDNGSFLTQQEDNFQFTGINGRLLVRKM